LKPDKGSARLTITLARERTLLYPGSRNGFLRKLHQEMSK